MTAVAGPRAAEVLISPNAFRAPDADDDASLTVNTRRGGRLAGRIVSDQDLARHDALQLVSPLGLPQLVAGHLLFSSDEWKGGFETSTLTPGTWTLRLLRAPPGPGGLLGPQPEPQVLTTWSILVEPEVDQLGLELAPASQD